MGCERVWLGDSGRTAHSDVACVPVGRWLTCSRRFSFLLRLLGNPAGFWHPVIIIFPACPFSLWFPVSLVVLVWHVYIESLLSARHWEHSGEPERLAFPPLSTCGPCVCVILETSQILFGRRDVNHKYGLIGPSGFLTTSLSKKSPSVYSYFCLYFYVLCLFFLQFFTEMKTPCLPFLL